MLSGSQKDLLRQREELELCDEACTDCGSRDDDNGINDHHWSVSFDQNYPTQINQGITKERNLSGNGSGRTKPDDKANKSPLFLLNLGIMKLTEIQLTMLILGRGNLAYEA